MSEKMINSGFRERVSKLILVFLAVSSLPAIQGCDLEDDTNVKTSFIWRYDTLRYKQGGGGGYVLDLWGADRSSLYAIVGFDDDEDILMRYTAGKFLPVYLDEKHHQYYHDKVDLIAEIEGTSPSNIWVVGGTRTAVGGPIRDSSYLVQYNGTAWVDHDLQAAFSLFSVAVAGEHTIFAAGNAGGIVKYEDGNESFIPFPSTITSNAEQFSCSELFYSGGILYGAGWVFMQGGTPVLFRIQYSDGKFSRADMINYEDLAGGRGGFWESAEGSLYSVGKDNAFRMNSDWDLVLQHDYDLKDVFGVSDGNYWITGRRCCKQMVNGVSKDHHPAPSTGLDERYGHGWTDGVLVVIAYFDFLQSTKNIMLIGE